MKLPFSYKETSKLVKATTLVVTVGVLQGCSSVPNNTNLVEIQPISTEQQLAQHLAEWETYKPQLEALLAAQETEENTAQANANPVAANVDIASTENSAEPQEMVKEDPASAAAQFQPKEQINSPQINTSSNAPAASAATATVATEASAAEPVVDSVTPGVQVTPAAEAMVAASTEQTSTSETMAKAAEETPVVSVDDTMEKATPVVEEKPVVMQDKVAQGSQQSAEKAAMAPSASPKEPSNVTTAEAQPATEMAKMDDDAEAGETSKKTPSRDGEYVVAEMATSANIDENDARSGSFEYKLSNDVLLDGDADPTAEPEVSPSIDKTAEEANENRYVRAQFQESERAKKIRLAKEAAAKKAQEAAIRAAQQREKANEKRAMAVKVAEPKVVTKALEKKRTPKVGEYGLQLVSHTRTGEAEKSWSKISRKFRTLLAGKEPIVEQAVVKNRQYYRLKVGPYYDKNIAVDTCKQLVLSHQDCIVSNYYGEPLE
ncbi:hypothetical protein CBF23_004995 [Marinomonas agarivorans]|nr:hypothetical protein CBF23_004995 [Marinomonas agarivorans]